MRRLILTPLLLSSFAFSALPACDGDNGTTPPADTSVGTDTTTPPTDTTTPNDQSTTPDVPAGDRDVKGLQAEAETVACDPQTAFANINPSVTAPNLVVTSPRFLAYRNETDETKNLHGYYVADQGETFAPWSGILVTVSVGANTEFAIGDVVTAQGQLVDYFCNTQISADSLVKTGTATPPAPLNVSAADATSEALEGTVVTIEGVEVVAKPNVYQVQGADGTQFEVGFDLGGNGFFISLDIGATYNLTGVMTYKFGKRQLMPMNAAGIVKTSTDPEASIVGVQSSAESTGCTTHGFNGANVTIPGAIVASARTDVSANLHGYYVTDGTGADYSGMFVTIGKSQNTDFAVGDVVTIAGRQQEWYCNTQFAASSMTKTGDGGTIPAPVMLEKTVTAADLEKVEGMLVELSGISVLESNPARDDLRATDAGALHIDNSLGVPVPAIGATLTTLRGIVRYAFDAYRVVPRDATDLVVAE